MWFTPGGLNALVRLAARKAVRSCIRFFIGIWVSCHKS